MNRFLLMFVVCTVLTVGSYSFYWYGYVAVSALSLVGTDPAGSHFFQTLSPDGQVKRIYPFTYAAAILSLAGIAYYIQKRLGGWMGLFTGVFVGVIATLGMIAVYEHTFLKLGDLIWEPKFWDAVYGTSSGRTLVAVMELSWNLATLPWWKRQNLAPAAMVYAAYLGLMLAWLGTGFKPIESGDPVAYALNASTRLLSQTVPVVLVRTS